VLISIITATYNRAHTLPRLYESLVSQKKKNFEWIIVDDASLDDTNNIIESYISEQKEFKIKFISNLVGCGKHRSINKALKLACGELFFSVDSDDYLLPEATYVIENVWTSNKNNYDNLLGICLRRINLQTMKIIGKPFPVSPSLASPSKYTFFWNIGGDKAEIFRTDICKKIPCPEFEGERFCTEALWIYRMEKYYPYMICVNVGVRFTEYLNDGLSSNFREIRRKNPKGYIAYYKELLKIPYVYLHPRIVIGVIKNIIVITARSIYMNNIKSYLLR